MDKLVMEKMLSNISEPLFLIKEKSVFYQNQAANQLEKEYELDFSKKWQEWSGQKMVILQNAQGGVKRWRVSHSDWQSEGQMYHQFVLHEFSGENEPLKQKQLMQYATNAYEIERKRISQELHDGVAQMIFSSQIALQNLQSDSLSEAEQIKLSTVTMELSEALAEIRNIALDLRPAALDDLGLKAAIDSLVDRYVQLSGIHIHFVSNLTKRMDETAELTLYRVVQEGLMNAIKYAQVLDIDVLLIEKKDCLTLEIVDLGVGFDPKQVVIQGSGLGLLNMKERVEALSGEFVLKSKENQGTHIMVTLPLSRRGEQEC